MQYSARAVDERTYPAFRSGLLVACRTWHPYDLRSLFSNTSTLILPPKEIADEVERSTALGHLFVYRFAFEINSGTRFGRLLSANYWGLPFEQRLQKLLDYAEVSPATVAQILGVSPAQAQSICCGNPLFSYGLLASKAHHLWRILINVLATSEYYTALMPYYWITPGVYDNRSSVRPPWYDFGIESFLKNRRDEGLLEAVRWLKIRQPDCLS